MIFMRSKGDSAFYEYLERVEKLYNEGKGGIDRIKYENLLTPGKQLDDGFVERQKKDTQYIAKATVHLLEGICDRVRTTSGSVTDYLRGHWKLKHLLQDLGKPILRETGNTEMRMIRDKRQVSIKRLKSSKNGRSVTTIDIMLWMR